MYLAMVHLLFDGLTGVLYTRRHFAPNGRSRTIHTNDMKRYIDVPILAGYNSDVEIGS